MSTTPSFFPLTCHLCQFSLRVHVAYPAAASSHQHPARLPPLPSLSSDWPCDTAYPAPVCSAGKEAQCTHVASTPGSPRCRIAFSAFSSRLRMCDAPAPFLAECDPFSHLWQFRPPTLGPGLSHTHHGSRYPALYRSRRTTQKMPRLLGNQGSQRLG